MGAASSTPEGGSQHPGQATGIVTVSAAAQPKSGAPAEEPLLQHLASLRARVPGLHASIDANDPENVWRDLEAAKALGPDTQQLAGAVGKLLGAYQAWHNENAQAIIANQAYVHRSIDQAEIKARKAVQHVRLQTQRLRALQVQLDAAKGLPASLAALCSRLAQQQAALEDLQRRAGASSSSTGSSADMEPASGAGGTGTGSAG